MLPLLEQCDIGGALRAGPRQGRCGNATPEHAAALQQARQVDSIIGLVVAPLLFLLLVGFAAWHWLRFGRDPVYLDDPSIHMPAPPADLTPASAALVWDGRSSRHTLTTALLDLASHGSLAFREEQTGTIVHHTKIGIETRPTVTDSPELRLIRRHTLSPAETSIAERLAGLPSLDETGYLAPTHLTDVATLTAKFDIDLEAHAVTKGWLSGPPTKVAQRWYRGAAIEAVAGIALFILGVNLPSQGFVLLGIALAAAGVLTWIIGRQMPARTMSGAMIRAMLAAYRRTLDKTMAQARSLRQVVDEAQLAWIETPDQAFVWGVALGLQSAVQGVLDRSFDDVRAGSGAGHERVVPDLVRRRDREWARRRLGWRGEWRTDVELADPEHRRDAGGDRDRRLGAVERWVGWRWRRLRRRGRLRWRRRRRRLLSRRRRPAAASGSAAPSWSDLGGFEADALHSPPWVPSRRWMSSSRS